MPKTSVHRLEIRDAFERLSDTEKLYAHHLSRAAWHGTRIILRQTSPEAGQIFDFILLLHKKCKGEWRFLADLGGISMEPMDAFLEFAAEFLSNIGNYTGAGDQKFVPQINKYFVQELAADSKAARELLPKIEKAMNALPPYALGLPSADGQTQSAYYPDTVEISKEEINIVSNALQKRSILPENTRIRKITDTNGKNLYEVLQASVQSDEGPLEIASDEKSFIQLVRGDHAAELAKICEHLTEAAKYASNDRQKQTLAKYVESFQTGDLQTYREAQKIWITDRGPRVENIFGFVESYRDPYGTKAEFEGIVAISDPEETKVLTKLVDNSVKFIRRLPWAENATENDGKGPFEKGAFEPPDFTSIHALAYCSSIIFAGINLPNYNDIRQECGFKNVIIANRTDATSFASSGNSQFVADEVAESLTKHGYATFYLWVVLHELLGHGTSKLLTEEPKGNFNFDIDNPPISPLTGKPINSWYRPGQTWTGQFEELANTVDECRAELVGAYLMDDAELLGLFGFDEHSESKPADITHSLYLQLGVYGFLGLGQFNSSTKKWGQAHSRAHFAILKWLLRDSDGFMTVECDAAQRILKVHVDRERILSHGKPSLGRLLLRLHMYRCTADVEACRELYEDLTTVEDEHLLWKSIVHQKSQRRRRFLQANTFLNEDGTKVTLKEYEATKEGIILSWFERAV